MIDEKCFKNAQIIDPFDDLTDEEKNEARLCAEKEMRGTANFFETLCNAKQAYDEWRELEETLSEHYFFEHLDWTLGEIHYNCEVREGCLYDSAGDLISQDDGCMDEEIPYFVNQTTGYLGDDYYGTMFVKLGDTNDFMEVTYYCF